MAPLNLPINGLAKLGLYNSFTKLALQNAIILLMLKGLKVKERLK